MSIHRRVFRQSLILTVAAGAAPLGACSNSDEQARGVTTPTAPEGSEQGAGGSPTSGSSSDPAPSADESPAAGGVSGVNEPATTNAAGAGGNPAPILGAGGAGGSSEPRPSGGDAGGNAEAGSGGTSEEPNGEDSSSEAEAGVPEVNDVNCPQTLGAAFIAAPAGACMEPGLACNIPVTCASGTQILTLTCAEDRWRGPVGCEQPYDYCPQVFEQMGSTSPGVYCEDGEWHIEAWAVGLADGLRGCPQGSPEEGTPCLLEGGTGGADREHCGYPCDGDPATWTVFTCTASADGQSWAWYSDGACE